MNKYLSAIAAYVAATKNSVETPEEIERRAAICRVCRYRVRTKGVSRVSKILGVLSGRHGVSEDVAKYSCGICSCNFLLLLPAKVENLHADTPKQANKRPAFCWMKKKI